MQQCPHYDGYRPEVLPHDVAASRHQASAKHYARAADMLFSSPDAGVRQPAFFALAHAVELLLKAFLLAREVCPKRLAKDIGHCLECLWAEAARERLTVPGYDMPVLMHHLSPYSRIFRYPDMEIQDTLNARELIGLFAALEEATKSDLLRASLDNIGPGRKFDMTVFTHKGAKEGES